MNDLCVAFVPKSIAFTQRPRAFFKIAWRGALRQLHTFGFYRFWLNSDLRTEADGC